MTAVITKEALELPSAQKPIDELAALGKALGHPARLEIIAMLHERQTCIGCDIVDQIGLAQSTTSEHLRILKTAGIITGTIDPPRVCYSLNAEVLERLCDFLRQLVDRPATKGENRMTEYPTRS